ncbi:MAG TPA: hypothetical protein VFC07_11735 [Verrucomicrobiae bacterium]|nr:hypothetical protein [Verrucomicrobiae bacterium]
MSLILRKSQNNRGAILKEPIRAAKTFVDKPAPGEVHNEIAWKAIETRARDTDRHAGELRRLILSQRKVMGEIVGRLKVNFARGSGKIVAIQRGCPISVK